MVLGISTIMTSTEPTDVFIHGEKIVDQRFFQIRQTQRLDVPPFFHQTLGHFTLPTIWRKVKGLYWEVYKRIYLVTQNSAIAEPLQVHDKEVRSRPYVELLGCLLVLLALRTVPKIIFSKLLLFGELL